MSPLTNRARQLLCVLGRGSICKGMHNSPHRAIGEGLELPVERLRDIVV